MVKGNKKLIVTAVILAVILILVNWFVFGFRDKIGGVFEEYRLDNYDIDVDITADGKAVVTETHTLTFKNRDNPWWNYYKVIDFNNFGNAGLDMSSITMSVDGVDYPILGKSIDFDNDYNYSSRYQYVGNSYYTQRSNTIELGVVMSDFDKGNRTIGINYTIDNILIDAGDTAVFYYQLVPANNAVSIKNMTSTITFPENSDEYLRTWLHITDAFGTVDRVANNRLEIKASDIPSKTYVETRTTLDKDNYSVFGKKQVDDFAAIVAEEEAWYAEHMEKVNREKIFIVIDVVVGIIALGLCLGLGIKDFMRKKRKIIVDAPEYLHEPPKGITLEEAMPIYHYYDDNDEDWWSDTISATMMNLVRKNYLAIIPGEKKKEAKVTILNMNGDNLTPAEKTVIELLHDASGNGAITMKEFEKWCKDNYRLVDKLLNVYKGECRAKGYNENMFYRGNKKPSNRGFIVAVIGIALSLAVIFAYNPLFIANIFIGIGGIALYVLDHLRFNPLTKKGEAQYLEIKAFADYMLDFSNFDEKTIPELVLWQEYLVWATGMGIADEVSKQLSIVYPEFRQFYEGDVNAFNTFTFWYLYSPSFRFNAVAFGRSMRESMTSIQAIKVAEAARTHIKGGGTGSGFGGGSFSGGGGGFGGGGGMGAR